jgi:hypothetical protein
LRRLSNQSSKNALAAAIVQKERFIMNEEKRLESEFPPASDRMEDEAPPAASERRPTGAKFDPEYDVVASARCFRANARLLLDAAETGLVIEPPALANYLTHVRELLLFTLGWLERRRAVGSAENAASIMGSVREIIARTRVAAPANTDEMLALGLSFDELAEALEAL